MYGSKGVRDRNDVIYPTTDTIATILPPISSQAFQNWSQVSTQTHGLYNARNSVGLGLSNLPGATSFYSYAPSANNPNNQFQVQLYVASPGASAETGTQGSAQPVNFQSLSTSLDNLPSFWNLAGGSSTTYLPGLNVSAPSMPNTQNDQSYYIGMLTTSLDIAALFAPPPADFIIGTASVMIGGYGILSEYQSTTAHPIINTATEYGGWFALDGGYASSYPYQNVYSGSNYFQYYINEFPTVMSEISAGGSITLNAQNQFSYYGNTFNSASTSITLPVEPAVSIGGYVYFTQGVPANNVPVTLTQYSGDQASAIFDLTTSSS